MSRASPPDLLVLHAVRILGMGDAGAVARRFGLDRPVVEELLLDHEAFGHVTRAEFAGHTGWTLTSRGRDEDNRRLAAELAETGARATVVTAHADFARLNPGFLKAVTHWQLRPTPFDRMAENDHTDWAWDERVLETLAGLELRLRPVGDALAAELTRLDGYPARLRAALDRVDGGERRWVDQPRIDSCHTVWFELHEDLLSTLGLERGDDR